MTTPSDSEARALLIKKLLHKAEAAGTTPEERDAFNAKAAQLMIQWGIDEALIQSADRVKIEQIVQKIFASDAPKSYSFEYALIGVEVANELGCRGLLQKMRDGRTSVLVVGFEGDTERVKQLYTSLVLQCTLVLGPWARVNIAPWATGTDKFNAKRSFIRGFASGVKEQLRAVRRQVVADAAPGTDLVLVDRTKQVTDYIDQTMNIGTTRPRRYTTNGFASGEDAGRRADVGGTKIGTTRKEVGR